VNIDTLSTAVSRFDLKAHCANQGGFALSVEQVLRKGQNLKSSERQMQFAYAQNAELVTRKGQEQMLNDGQNLVGFALSAELGFAQNAELGFALSAELVTRKGQNPIRVVKNSNNLQQEVVEKNTATSKIEPLASQEKLGGGYLSFSQKQKTVQFVDLKQLIIPNIILEVEYPTLQIILNKSKNPQLILDELLGQSKIRNIAAPCAYLRTLVNKELTGDLIIAHAHRIQAKRLASQQMAHALEASREGSHAANMLSTEAIALQAEQTQQGKEILAKLREQWARNTSPKQAKSESLEVVV
jgi:hypothetical protein